MVHQVRSPRVSPAIAFARDSQESQNVVSRPDQARVGRILADHDPWKEVG